MIRKCNVIMNNGLNMVVDFAGTKVQMPSVGQEKEVYVKLDNDKFSLTSEAEYIISDMPVQIKPSLSQPKRKKKTDSSEVIVGDTTSMESNKVIPEESL